MKLHMNPLSSRLFDVGPRGLVTEASQLGSAFKIERIFDDACDVGIAIRSTKTERIVTFALIHTDEHEGDILGWHFESMGLASPVHVTIIND